MGSVLIQKRTVEDPLTLMGEEAGICWGADISNPEKNKQRGVDCINSDHGRAMEFPQIYMVLDGYDTDEVSELFGNREVNI